MEIDAKNVENQVEKLSYAQPELKNYGTMQELTLGGGGSPGDAGGDGNVNDEGTSGGGGLNPGAGNL